MKHVLLSRPEGDAMDWDEIEGRWQELSASFRKKFNRLTEEDIEQLSGSRPLLVQKLVERYSYSSQLSEQSVESWRQSLNVDAEIPTSTSGAPTY